MTSFVLHVAVQISPLIFTTCISTLIFCCLLHTSCRQTNFFQHLLNFSFQPPDFGYLSLWMWMPVISLCLTPVSVYRNPIECTGLAWMPFRTLSTQTKRMSLFWNFMRHLCHSHKAYYCFVSGHFYVTKSCPTPCHIMNCSLPGSSVHDISQKGMLELVAVYLSRESSSMRDWTLVSCITGKFFNAWATREAQRKMTNTESLHLKFSQVRILEWVVIFFSRGSFWPRDWTWVSCIVGRFFTVWATREAVIS